jgi:M6 family metalloprotease-like protein
MAGAALLGLAGLTLDSWAAPKPFLNCTPAHLPWGKPGKPAPLAKRTAADTVEKVKGLVVLVDFPDKRGTVSRTEIDNMINQPGYSGLYGNGSVRDYWLTASRGKLEYSATVIDYYTTLRKRSYYESVDNSTKFMGYVDMFNEVLKNVDAKGFDFSSLSRDSAGSIRAVTILFAGAFDLDASAAFPLAPRYLPSGDTSNGTALILDGVKLSEHMLSCVDCFPDQEKAFSRNIFMHEMGHLLFNWPDLYGQSQDLNARGGLGNYCIMSLGPMTTPPPPNPFLRWLQGQCPGRPGQLLHHVPGPYDHSPSAQPFPALAARMGDAPGNFGRDLRHPVPALQWQEDLPISPAR